MAFIELTAGAHRTQLGDHGTHGYEFTITSGLATSFAITHDKVTSLSVRVCVPS